jgi:mannose-6-phosphate isomerase-like protein (cupin superfamily)
MTLKYVFNTQQVIPYRFPTHRNDLVIDRADAATAEVFITVLEPGESAPLHIHHDCEQIFHVIEGAGKLYIGKEEQAFDLKPGDVARIPPSTWHRTECTSPQALRYLSVDCFVGGKPSAEPTWESHVKEICKINGWDFDAVRNKT